MKTLGNVPRVSPILGISRSDTDACSKCGHEIPDEAVPLILWSKDGNSMWVYCKKCEGMMIRRLIRKVAP